MIKNWKTSSLGILGIITVLIGAAKALLDGDPLTVPDWNLVINGVVLGGLGLLAKDAGATGA